MIKKIFKDVFQIRLPLPYSPLNHLNSYVIKSKNKNLLIDTGLNFPETFQALSHGLKKVGLDTKNLTDILLTHFHIDHVGLVPKLAERSKELQLSIHHIEADFSKEISEDSKHYIQSMKNFLKIYGAPIFISENLEKYHPAFFEPEAYLHLATVSNRLEDDDQITIGRYSFKVLWTPGHSPGHVCLYESSRNMLISGDHLLPTISPHVAQFMEDMNPLEEYLESLNKIEKLKVEVVLPAHEEIFTTCYERIRQLKDHHKKRLDEILSELGSKNLTAFELASRIQWDVHYKYWKDFPPFQKYLALGETVAHLSVLEKNGMVNKNMVDGIFIYSRK